MGETDSSVSQVLESLLRVFQHKHTDMCEKTPLFKNENKLGGSQGTEFFFPIIWYLTGRCTGDSLCIVTYLDLGYEKVGKYKDERT